MTLALLCFFAAVGFGAEPPVQMATLRWSGTGRWSADHLCAQEGERGDAYTLKAKVADTAGDLHELTHEYVVENQ